VIRLSVSDGKLQCQNPPPDRGWTICVSDVVLIAEYTTDEGPNRDDYFLVFITREQGELYYSNVTMYAAGIEESLTNLESVFGCSLDLTLHSSTKLNSRVVWPRELAGFPYFSYEQVVPHGLWEPLRTTVRGKQIESHVSESICEYLAKLIQPKPDQPKTDQPKTDQPKTDQPKTVQPETRQMQPRGLFRNQN